jgi:DNA (cytosine-5)-methyltransferase 1
LVIIRLTCLPAADSRQRCRAPTSSQGITPTIRHPVAVEQCSEPLAVVDLFCGVGGFSEGARRAGCRIVLAVDSDATFLETHRRNHPRCTHLLRTLPADVPLPNGGEWHVHASPPCQPVSQANRGACPVERAGAVELAEWYFDLVEATRPTSWSFEQVVTIEIVVALEARRARRPDLFAFAVINFGDHGVPQDRRRLVAGSPGVIARLLRRRGPELCIFDVFPRPPTRHVMNHSTNTPDRVNGGFRPLLAHEHMRHASRRAYTVMASAAMRWVRPSGEVLRSLTPREAARLQTFPPRYHLGEVARRGGVGNAVPVEVARRWMAPEEDAE